MLRRGHEIIRQGRRDLTLVRMTPDLIYDQMVAAGTARRLVFSYLGNPGVGPLNPDVAIFHAQRADRQGNTQMWGLLGAQKEAAFAARTRIVVVEEIIDEAFIRADPNRTLIPDLIVDAVVHEPYGAHPSYVQGYYDRDNAFYLEWDSISREPDRTQAWLDEWVLACRGA